MTTLVAVWEKKVSYIGLSDVRIIRREDWAQIGIDHRDTVWDKSNGWSIPCALLPIPILEYCQHDPELVIA